MDGEIIHPLFGLLDEGVLKDFPVSLSASPPTFSSA